MNTSRAGRRWVGPAIGMAMLVALAGCDDRQDRKSEEQLAAIRADKEKLQAELDKARSQIKSRDEEIADLKKADEPAQLEIGKYRDQLAGISQTMEVARTGGMPASMNRPERGPVWKTVDEFAAETVRLKAENESLDGTRDELEKRCRQREDDLAAIRRDYAQRQKELTAAQRALDKLQLDGEAMKLENGRLAGRLAAAIAAAASQPESPHTQPDP